MLLVFSLTHHSSACAEEGAKNTPKADMIGADQGLQSIEEAPQSNPANLGPAGVGMKGAPAPANDDGRDEGQGPKPPNLGSNPYRALGNAMEKWKANLSTVEEADQKQVCASTCLFLFPGLLREHFDLTVVYAAASRMNREVIRIGKIRMKAVRKEVNISFWLKGNT